MMGYWDQIGYKEGNWELAKKLHERKTAIFMELVETGKIPLRPGAVLLLFLFPPLRLTRRHIHIRRNKAANCA